MAARHEFWDAIEKMHGYMTELRKSHPIPMHTRAERKALRGKLPYEKGVYVLYERGRPMYVGRSDKLADRLLDHSKPSSGSETASFAFNLARNKARAARQEIPDAGTMSRKSLQEHEKFQQLFREAKDRVRRMEVQAVEVTSPIEQTILEVYLHLKFDTRFNSFDNH